MAGDTYLFVAFTLSLGYLAAAVRFACNESSGTARTLVWTSLAYLPMLLSTLVWDHFRLLS
jgi:protoheme IX farnesyltransferase